MQQLVETLEFVLFVFCLYLAYLGCKQDMRQQSIAPQRRNKRQYEKRTVEKKLQSAETEPPSYNEIVT